MSRQRRIASALAVLAVGTAAAFPFRRSAPEPSVVGPIEAVSAWEQRPVASPALPTPAADDDRLVAAPIAAASPVTLSTIVGLDPSATEPPAFAEPDGAPRPDPTGVAAPLVPEGVVYQTAGLGAASSAPVAEPEIYVIHNGDTLERIAARRLGDERRALEIFDLNRDVLTNPYLLPLGAELQLPPRHAP